MKTFNWKTVFGLTCSTLITFSAGAQTVIEDFEYPSESDLLSAWFPQASTLSLSSWVAPGSKGTHSMRVDREYGTGLWETEILTPPPLVTPLTIGAAQYVALRVTGEPQFTNASFQTLFLYAYDGSGNFGRWGSPIPTSTTNWQIMNFLGGSIQLPWDSPGAPDLANIVQLKLYLFGQGDPAGAPYSATVYFDDIVVRDTPLVETPPATFGPAMIEGFEYADDAALLARWTPSFPALTTLSLSSEVSPKAAGTKSLTIVRDFGAVPWETEALTGPVREVPMGITANQYLTWRISGDPELAKASFQTLFLYAFDAAGNFGRWGAPVPTSTNWQVINLAAGSIGKPWDSPSLPNLSNIVQFKFFLYGQGDPAGEPYTATIRVDDVQVRDTALIEFPAPSAMRGLIDDFESYADNTALRGFYSYLNSPAATATAATLETPAPQGSKALKLGVDFSSGQYPWGSVRSSVVAPFSIPTNAVVTFKVKGDATLAPVADAATSFWLTFYDESGRAVHYTTSETPVVSSDWTTLRASYADFWGDSVADTGNLVQWRILVQGWEGTSESPAQSAAIYVDDIRVVIAPTLAIVRDGSNLKLQLGNLVPGAPYAIRQTTDFVTWTSTALTATGASQTWTIPAGQLGFFQVAAVP
jgi:hypothetical protein